MNISILILATLLVTLVSTFLILILKFTSDKLFAFGSGFGVGMGLVSLQLYIYSRVSIPWTVTTVLIPWITIFIIIAARYSKIINKFKLKVEIRGIDAVIIVLILLSFLYTGVEAVLRPPVAWDSWAIWLMKSKSFFIDGYINFDLLRSLQTDYPLLISLGGTFYYILFRAIDDHAVLISSTLYLIFTAILLFSVLRNKFTLTYSLFIVYLFVTVQNLIRHGGRMEAGQADLPLGYFFFLCAILLLAYIKKPTLKNLIFLNIIAGFTALVKFDALTYLIVVWLISLYFIITKKLYKQIILSLIWLVPIFEWEVVIKTNNIVSMYFSRETYVFNSDKIFASPIGYLKEFLNVKKWSFIWISYVILQIKAFGFRNTEIIILNILVVSQLLIYFVLYMFITTFNAESSLSRLLIHVAPIVMLIIAVEFRKYILR